MPAGRPGRPGPAAALLAVVLALAVGACGIVEQATPTVPPSLAAAPSGGPSAGPSGAPAPPPPGHELYGFVPYWEMDAGIADHLASTPVSTVALFSVTHNARGGLRTGQAGYQRITGDVGRQIVREAHGRGARADLVYTSFGRDRNATLFGDLVLQDKVIASLVLLTGDLGLDGVNVDVEALDPLLVPAYGAFVGRLRAALVAADPGDRVTVSTSANELGAAMAAAAVAGGVDRVFLMGYDYRTGGSDPGATSPLARRDGDPKDLPWSLDMYAALGVPADRLLLGLPLYGVSWPVLGPEIGAPATGRGATWILRNHADLLLDESTVPVLDPIEQVDVYVSGSDGSTGPPSLPPVSDASASPEASSGSGSSTPPVTWQAVYVDSPATLATKLQLARDRGLAGAGFWAIGYERGLPGYTDVMRTFAAGRPLS